MGGRPSTAGLGPELELLALAIGIKPTLRLSVAPHRAASVVERWEARGLTVVRVDRRQEALLYVGREAEDAGALAEAEAPILPGGERRAPDAAVREAHRALGRRLGYPRCCVDAYLERLERGVTVRHDGGDAAELVVAAEEALRRSDERWGRLSFLLPRRRALVPFDPCRFDCELAGRYATALHRALELRRPAEARKLRDALVREVRLSSDGRRLGPSEPERPALVVAFDRF